MEIMNNNKNKDSIVLKRLLNRFDLNSCESELERKLAFYKIIIDYERCKEPDIQNYYEYPINYKEGNESLILIDIPCNDDFKKVFEENLDRTRTKFPKDLYISLQVFVNNKSYKLLNIVVVYDDFKGFNPEEELFPVAISNFQLDYFEIDKLELDSLKADTISEKLKGCNSIHQILTVLKQELGEDVYVSDVLLLSLSSKNIALSQLASELSNEKMKKGLSKNTLLANFLNYDSFKNKIDGTLEPETLISVMPLDESQRNAIAAALTSRVTVITGAPGTGKTQVIENLIANALLQGKKILVTSKNNKAVDNVKDRFKGIVGNDYFLRFGSKSELLVNTIPVLDKFSKEIPNINFEKKDYQDLLITYRRNVDCIAGAKKLISTKERLGREIERIQRSSDLLMAKIEKIKANHQSSIQYIENNYSEIDGLKLSPSRVSSFKNQFVVLRNTIDAKFTGLFGFWHNWFSKRKYAMKVLNLVESFPIEIKRCFSLPADKTSVTDFKCYDDLKSYCNLMSKTFERFNGYLLDIGEENSSYNKDLTLEEVKLAAYKEERAPLQKEYDGIDIQTQLNIIESCSQWIANNSLLLLNGCINCNLKSEASTGKLMLYKMYFPDKIPYRDNDYISYIDRARAFLDVFGVCSVTSLSTKSAFPLASELFDMLIIDEASQCDVASALPLIMRAKQLVVIGDPMQLRHITSVKEFEESYIRDYLKLGASPYLKYVKSSLWDYTNDFVCKSRDDQNHNYMLESHFRCHPEIIGYSNDMFYRAKLGHALTIKTDVSRLKWKQQGIYYVDVKGVQTSDDINVNKMEVDKAIKLASKLAKMNSEVSIGIITPFKDQAEALNRAIPVELRDRIDASTVNKYQGDERDVIVYTLVVTGNSPKRKINWIDKVVPNLVNVAVTRAKSALYVIGNMEYVKANSSANDPLGYLVRYKS